MKRQFHEAASALRTEAGLGEQLVVPIDCQQGLLYEWWAVFWDVFSTGNGKPQPSPEAIQFMNVRKDSVRLIASLTSVSSGATTPKARSASANGIGKNFTINYASNGAAAVQIACRSTGSAGEWCRPAKL